MSKYSVWSGRFKNQSDAIMQEINASIYFDHRLAKQDIRCSLAHVKMLGKQNIISKKEMKAIIKGLELIHKELENNQFEFKPELEDIHMNIEARLSELVGPVAGRLHTARSRNDQVATDFRLWIREKSQEVIYAIQKLQHSLVAVAEQNIHTIMPGFTHLQCAQPITFAHHLLAYVAMLQRDQERFLDAGKRLNECPLGSAALAGTSFPIDQDYTADMLGFSQPVYNSIDGVSSRDFALEYLSSVAICAMHLSRFAEELVMWSSSQFELITLSDKYTTGSSIMPQKRNPDAAELIRAKTGRINGDLISLLTVLKGLPLAYSKDMQEDKEPVFDASDTICIALEAMNGMINDLEPQHQFMANSAKIGFSTATDLADHLVRINGLPFREAHKIVGQMVLLAEQRNCQLDKLPLEAAKSIYPKINQNDLDALSIEESVDSKTSKGGTSPKSVIKQINYWKEKIS